APLAMLVIFILLLVFFRKLLLILSPMILAMVSVIVTMGLLIVTGNTVHIMSSMIPIFIMPIAVLDSVHILSEFFERYQATRDRRKTMSSVMETLFMPMLYTSLTTAAGFGSLAITPIPPVQIFGIFVALGVLLAWIFTVTFIPAFVMFIPQKRLENFGATHSPDSEAKAHATLMGRFLDYLGGFTYRRVKVVLGLGVAAIAVTVFGMTKIVVNDNPTKWFKASHPIRVADTVLNEHFGGTYMAYIALERPAEAENIVEYADALAKRLDDFASEYGLAPLVTEVKAELAAAAPETPRRIDLVKRLQAFAGARRDVARDQNAEDRYDWEEVMYFLDAQLLDEEVFKRPEALQWMDRLQARLATVTQPEYAERPLVGKSNSVADIVKTVHRDLFGGDEAHFTIPERQRMIGECLDQFQNGNRRMNDLWHFVTSDYQQVSVWVQLRGGDNQDMSRVVDAVAEFAAQDPPPAGLALEWFGLTYINVIWQEKMVWGMLSSFLGSFLIVLFMMIILFRSGIWGILSMIPLTITIGLIYGVIGLIGKDYDMPVAVLSALTLGMAIDFAIHFLARAAMLYEKCGSWEAAHVEVFGEPARAIMRNVIVIAVGFLPLLAAPLMPYVTVGVFMAAILLVSGVGTLFLLPALLTALEGWAFPKTPARRFTCRFGTLFLTAATLVGVVVLNIQPFIGASRNLLTVISVVVLVILAIVCWITARRAPCRIDLPSGE
ncbi:MAG TPA: MMPL family transporter, partial [Candidatus Hydrogenedentes bacterium]|nr:MMPL family transporter [Candidatus Hydrogenedentota bacterium]